MNPSDATSYLDLKAVIATLEITPPPPEPAILQPPQSDQALSESLPLPPPPQQSLPPPPPPTRNENNGDASPSWLPPCWRVTMKTRKNGRSAGNTDKYYVSPEGKKFRSRKAVEAYLSKQDTRVCEEKSEIEAYQSNTSIENVAKEIPPEAIVAILLSDPVHVPGMVKLYECHNYQHLAAEIDRIYSEYKRVPKNPNPSIVDPMPGYIVSYLPAAYDAPNLDPSNQPWESFAAALDLITAVPI